MKRINSYIGASVGSVKQSLLCMSMCAALLLQAGCHKTPAIADDNAHAAVESSQPAHEAGVELTAEETSKLGILTTAAQTATFATETEGYGVVMPHDALAQAAADIVSAEAAVRQSRAAVERARQLASTPGAFPADIQETAERQAAVDAAALTLARRRLSAVIGLSPPWRDDTNNTLLNELANGHVKLIRATFPLGTLTTTPHSLRIAPLVMDTSQRGWTTTTVWDAPADTAFPGRSVFATLKQNDLGESERVQAWVASGTTENGVWIPTAAVVMSDGKYWCYVQRSNRYTRVAITLDAPQGAGYFIRAGLKPGDPVVTAAAGLLLARENGSSEEAE